MNSRTLLQRTVGDIVISKRSVKSDENFVLHTPKEPKTLTMITRSANMVIHTAIFTLPFLSQYCKVKAAAVSCSIADKVVNTAITKPRSMLIY